MNYIISVLCTCKSFNSNSPNSLLTFSPHQSITFDMHWPAYNDLMVADDLAPNGCQAINNHHANLTVTKIYFKICISCYKIILKKIHFKMSSAKSQPFCLGLDVLNNTFQNVICKISAISSWPRCVKQYISKRHLQNHSHFVLASMIQGGLEVSNPLGSLLVAGLFSQGNNALCIVRSTQNSCKLYKHI